MSNLSGSYKVGVGDVQGVDLREQERRARLSLLDHNREPSPQPIFGEPVKVELEDETSRRIKNTLGDVTQVLVNDPKSLIGISRSVPASGYSSNGYQVPAHPPNSHQISGHTSSSHPMSGQHSNSHPLSGQHSNSHPMSGHPSNSHPMSGHPSNSHPMSGLSSNSHPMSGHPSNSHPLSGHPSNSHHITGHPSSSHPLPGHLSNSHPITGHPSNSHPMPGHPISGHLGHPSNSHPMPGHPSGHPSSGYPMTGLPVGVHPITGHPSNGHPSSGHPSSGHPITGYSATGYTGAGHINATSRPQAASKKVPLPANNANMTKPPTPSMPNMFPKAAPDKRNSYNRHKPESPVATSKPFHTPTFNNIANTQHQLQYQTQELRLWNNEQKRPNTVPHVAVNINFNNGSYNTISNCNITMSNNVPVSTCAPIWSCGPETPAIQMNPFHLPACATPSTANKSLYNCPGQNVPQIQKFDPANNIPSQKRPVVRPSHLKIPDRKPTSPIGVETILKEMTKPVPAPLTAIQTPRNEETGFPFPFPPEPKEELQFAKVEEKANPSNPHQEQKPKDVCQSSSMPFASATIKVEPKTPEMSSCPESVSYDTAIWKQTKPANSETKSESEVTKYTSSSLQDDLAMSESDEEAGPEKKENLTDYLKSPSSNPTIVSDTPTPAVTSTNTMETNSASSSSSESGDSDSDDDSSESNNTDSSSDSSDEDTSSMKWGLSNFVDESRRNQSPALRNLEMQKQLNNANNANVAVIKDAFSPPVPQPLRDFIVPDTPVTAKSDILSPIRSPAHPTVGPRTPPTPVCTTKSDSLEGNDANPDINDIKLDSSLPEVKSSSNISDASSENVLCGVITDACDESKVNIPVNTSTEGTSSEVESSPLAHSSVDDVNQSKDIHATPEKENTTTEIKSSPPPSDTADENYPIKTRQKGVTSTKKAKSANIKKTSSSSQNVEVTNSPPIAKFKHPRACRKSNEKPTVTPVPAKSEQMKEPKKRVKMAGKLKDVISPEKNKSQKPLGSVKKPPKTNVKRTKPTKMSTKQNVEIKKGEVKNKNKKFVVENFLQSPTFAGDTNLPGTSMNVSPSSEKLSLNENKKHTDTVQPTSSSTSTAPKKSVKSSSKMTNKSKNNEKLRRSARCSERASSLTQTETPTTSTQSSEKTKKPVKKSLKSKSHAESLPISIEPPLQILSPIPHDSPVLASTSDYGSQKKIMVCIPLSKLLRIPTILHQIQEPDTRVPSKSRSTGSTEDVRQKKDVTCEKSLKSVTNKCSQSKDFKDKPRTLQSQKSNKSKTTPVTKKEMTSKPLSEISSKSASNVNKISTKSTDKTICDVENKLPKKRKAEGDAKQSSKKKPKLSSRSVEEKKSKEQSSATKIDSCATQNDGSKPKTLERCDSASSLSSLCSQISQRSSKSLKEKKDQSLIHESKRLKTSASSISVKDIKQEKEDRPKLHIKKEPVVPVDKVMKPRDKSASTDIDCKEKDLWNDNINASSQYCHWDDSCKEDSKVPLENIMDNSTMKYDHFAPELHKELKEASAIKMLNDQGPIMPMDYYWTEGRKMKKMAEMEKDPFQQAVKFFEAAVLYVLTSQQKEENSKNPDAVYQFYYETLSFTTMMLAKIKKLQSCPGSTEFKLLILCLKCQSLLNVKLYSLKIKEIKEQLEGVSDFFRAHCSSPIDTPNPNLPSLHQSRISSLSTVSSPHSVIAPSPNSVSSQTSGYVSSEVSGPLMRNTVCVPQTVLDTIYRQHTHFKNLHMGHDLWEQADMYMTRSNLKEFFKEVADQSEPLTLHSTIKELVSYMQKGICLVKKYLH